MTHTGGLSTFAATLFALLNPLGMLPVFIGFTAGRSESVRRWLAFFISLTVLGLMLLFLLTGSSILAFFGITLDSFRVAGGIILLLIGIQIVGGTGAGSKAELDVDAALGARKEAESVYKRIVVPFAMPLLVGPGVIATLILYASEAHVRDDGLYVLGLVAVTIAVSLLTWVILLGGQMLQRVLGEVGFSILTRILGLLVASIGVQFVLTGITKLVLDSIAPALHP
jgi:MarC family membrane protein